MIYKALTVRQPWASLIAAGTKTIEIRSKPTHYRGDLLICAGARKPRPLEIARAQSAPQLPLGHALCIVRVAGCRPMTPDDVAAAGGADYAPGLFAWEFADIRPVTPFPVKGSLSFFTVAPPTQTGTPPAPGSA